MKRPLPCLLLIAPLLASCGGPARYAENETFAADPKFHRDFTADATPLCDAARRVMLGDGYIVTRPDGQKLIAGKEFQIDDKQHAIVNLYVNCEARSGGATLFVTASEEHFDVKTRRQSSSIGFPILAPLYFGTVNEADGQVKISGQTVTQDAFYERFYRAVQRELRAPK